MTTTTFPSQKQLDLAAKFAPQLSAIGITQEEILQDAWRFQAVNRDLEPKSEVLGAIKALKGKPIYKRSNREAQMQLAVLTALQELMQGKVEEATAILTKEFVQREKAAS